MAVFYFETESTDPYYNLAYEEHLLKSRRRPTLCACRLRRYCGTYRCV